MANEFRKILSDEAITPHETFAMRLSDEPTEATAAETAGADLNACRPYVNDRLNSRLAQTLPVGDWTIRSSVRLESGTRPRHILHDGDRIIVQGDGPWRLFDTEFQTLASGYLDGSDAVIDTENKLLYFVDSTGMLEARRLSDGGFEFSVSLLFGRAYFRSFIARRNEQMLVVSTERVLDQDAKRLPEKSTVEVLEFGDSAESAADGDEPETARVVAELLRKTLILRAALRGKTLVAATENQICLIDFDLQIRAALNGEFSPVVLSLNDSGIIYAVVSIEDALKLTAVKFNGEILYSTDLPSEMADISHPPIIGYDNRVFLLKDGFLTAFDAGGNCLWEYKSRNQIAGAVVTAENQLLIADGSEVGVFEADNRYHSLYEFKGEILQTPPTLVADGNLIVATNEKIYNLTIQTT